MTVSVADVAWFAAEAAVYVGVGWWGATRGLGWPGGLLLALFAVVAMAATWGLFAAPEASLFLAGPVGVAFRSVWFGLGAFALLIVVTRR